MSHLELEHVANSTLVGRTQTFDQPVVRLGRRPDNDVAFDAHRDQAASGYHAEIRDQGDQVVIVDLNSSNGTFVNGQKVTGPTPLRVGDRIRLASDGPEIVIKSLAGAAAPAPTPAAPPPPPRPAVSPAVRPFGGSAPSGAPPAAGKQSMGVNTIMGVVERAATQERKKNRKTLLAVGTLAVAAMAAAAGAFVLKGDGASVSGPDWATVAADAAPAVYVVVLRNDMADELAYSAQGTAWVVADGVLATNAHVAQLFLDRDEHTTVLARSVGPETHDVEIVAAVQHPGYSAFGELAARYMPFDPGTERFGLGVAAAYDVAILKVKDSDKAKLAAPLKIATDEELEAVRAGREVATIGYPSEGKQGWDVSNPVSSKDFKEVTRLSDIFHGNAESHDRAYSYMYSLNAVGGASGSPVLADFGGRARVVGLIASIDSYGVGQTGARIAAGSTSYGPRADLVAELLDGSAERLHAERMPWMEAQFLKRFRVGTESPKRLAAAYMQQSLAQSPEPPKAVFASEPATASLSDVGKGAAVDVMTFSPPARGRYTLCVFSRDHPYPVKVQLRSGRGDFTDVPGGDGSSYLGLVSFEKPISKRERITVRVYVEDATPFKECRVTAVWFKVG